MRQNKLFMGLPLILILISGLFLTSSSNALAALITGNSFWISDVGSVDPAKDFQVTVGVYENWQTDNDFTQSQLLTDVMNTATSFNEGSAPFLYWYEFDLTAGGFTPSFFDVALYNIGFVDAGFLAPIGGETPTSINEKPPVDQDFVIWNYATEVVQGDFAQVWILSGIDPDTIQAQPYMIWTDGSSAFAQVIGPDVSGTGNGGTAPIPEPATLLLLGTGMLAAAGAFRRKRSVPE